MPMNKENDNIKLVPKLRFPEFRELEEWAMKPFDELFTIGSGRDYKHLEEGDYPVYGTGGYMLSVDDYLYDGKSACIGRKGTIDKPILLSGKFWTVDTLFYTHSFKDCTPDFIYLLFQNINWKNYNEAGGVPSLSKNIIYAINQLVPKQKEQQKIVECIYSLNNLIATENEKLETLKAHKKGLLQQLFPAKGEKVPKLRFGEFSGEWELKKFSNYIKLYRGSSPRPIKKYLTTDEDGVNWIKIGDTKSVDNFILTNVSEKITSKGAEKSRKVNEGELILANSMSYGATYQLDLAGCIYDGWFVLREFESFFDKQFLLQLLNSNYMQIQYKRLAAGGIVQNISSEIVYNTILPRPSISEQQKIAATLFSLDDALTAQSDKINALNEHKDGLMQKMFPNINSKKL